MMDTALPSTSSEIKHEDISGQQLEPEEKPSKPLNMSPGAVKLRSWLNKSFRIEMTDGRVLVGIFLCTDRDSNIILGSCAEYLPVDDISKHLNEEPRMLGLVMIPGKHIVSMHVDTSDFTSSSQNLMSKNDDLDVM